MHTDQQPSSSWSETMSPVKFRLPLEVWFPRQTGWLSWRGGDRNLPLFINAGSLGLPLSQHGQHVDPNLKGKQSATHAKTSFIWEELLTVKAASKCLSQ